MGIRRWLRRIERDAKESADTTVLEDEEDLYREYPWMKEILPRLDRLVHRNSGDPFFLEDMTHTGKAASNTMSEE